MIATTSQIGDAVLSIGLLAFVLWATIGVARRMQRIQPRPRWATAAIAGALIGFLIMGGTALGVLVRGWPAAQYNDPTMP